MFDDEDSTGDLLRVKETSRPLLRPVIYSYCFNFSRSDL